MIDSRPVAVVTGASRGIGRAVALALAADGHAVGVNYVQSVDRAAEVVAEIESVGGTATAIKANIGLLSEHDKLIDDVVHRWGRLDVLVNNAGITSPGRRDVLEASEAAWDEVLSTNLKGPFFLAQRAARAMIQLRNERVIKRGTVVNISSVSAYAVSLNRPDYCIAKAGMQMMTSLFATRLAEEAIRVYEICPGIIASDMTAPVKEKYDRLIDDGLSPIKRWGRVDDVASAVSMVVAGHLPFSTGERINVDGGFHIRRL